MSAWELLRPTIVTAAKALLARNLDRKQAVLVLGILILNLVDALFTLRHVSYGALELNPLMAELLGGGSQRFVAVKHLLVSCGVIVIVIRSDRRLARVALTGVFALFTAVAIYHTALLYHQ
jgi:hypothetical protein